MMTANKKNFTSEQERKLNAMFMLLLFAAIQSGRSEVRQRGTRTVILN
ncbi:MAG: hypothetical protein AAF203_09615 [Pseudomonadota bacterium]